VTGILDGKPMRAEQFREAFFEAAPRYQWLETLGRGGVGIVFKALDVTLDDVVAIKVLSPDVYQEDSALLQRFKREINLNRRIKHPNVARLHDFGMAGEFPYITMEFVPGKDLWTLIQERGKLSPGEAVPILRQIARGTDAVHRLGIIHRDLKSQNIIVDDAGAAVIVDFGLARGKANENFTLDSVILGTPHYMSPEQASGNEVDARSDIYSIGIIAFEVLTGHVPFTGPSPLVVAMRHINEPIPDDLAVEPEVTAELRAVVMRALAKVPDERFPSAEELETNLALVQQRPEVRPKESELVRMWAAPEALLQELESALDSIARKAQPADAEEPRAAPPTTMIQKDAPSVLVASAVPADVSFLSAALTGAGLHAVYANSGHEVLETLFKRKLHVALLDVDLPGMDGFDVARIIKSQPQFRSLPILLLSSRPDRSQTAFAIQSGATDLLAKPPAPAALAARVWQLLHHLGHHVPPEQAAAIDELRPASSKGRTRAQ